MLKKLSKYGSVAAGAALSDWVTFTLMIFIGVVPVIALGLARVVGGLFSFFINKYWSFSAGEGSITVQGRRFLLLYCVTYSLAIVLFVLFTKNLEVQVFIAKLIIDVICFLFNYIIMHTYVFHDRKGLSHVLRKLFTG